MSAGGTQKLNNPLQELHPGHCAAAIVGDQLWSRWDLTLGSGESFTATSVLFPGVSFVGSSSVEVESAIASFERNELEIVGITLKDRTP